MDAPKIKVDTASLGEIMRDMKDGNIRIPRFQRDFVWGHQKTAALFDSMSREYPIGTFFLWKAPAKYNELIRIVEDLDQANLEQHQDHRLILDGQQRLTSLYATIFGMTIESDNYGKLSLDLDQDQRDQNAFALRKFFDNQRYVAVKDLLAPEPDYLKIYEGLKSEHRKACFLKVRQQLMTYPFSVITVDVDDIEAAINIFERINQEGQKLSRFDLVAAHVYDKDFDLRERVEEDFRTPLRKKGFGVLPESIVPQALVINLHKPVNFRSQVSMKSLDVQQIWKDTVASLLKAVDHLRENWGVENNKYLPYDQMLPVFAHYFYLSKQRQFVVQ